MPDKQKEPKKVYTEQDRPVVREAQEAANEFAGPLYECFGPTPWLRHPNESALWYDRFMQYLTLGPRRTVPKAVMKSQGKDSGSNVWPNAWFSRAGLYRWADRAAAYDQHIREQELDQSEKERTANHLARIEILNRVKDIFLDKLEELRDDPIKWQNASSMLRVMMQEMRTEFDGPTQEGLDVEIGPIKGSAKEALKVRIMQVKQRLTEIESASEDETPPSG